MKHKYHIRKDVRQETLFIQEFAVLSADAGKSKYPEVQDDDYSLLCEQSYSARDIKGATDKDDLILLLRNQHFFPIGIHMDKIADVIMGMYAAKGELQKDLVFDDKAILVESLEEQENVAEITDDVQVDQDES